jgi:hypothetical protein
MSTGGLDLTLFLLSIAAPIGAIDVLYFHIYKFKLARRPESRAETMTHIARSLMLAPVLIVVVMFEPTGWWFWALAALFVIDFVNSAVDAYLERDSRAGLGGLPRLEYIIHIVGATLMGAVAASFLIRGWHLGGLETALAPRAAAAPLLMQINAVAIAVSSVGLAAYETAVLLRSTPVSAEAR